MSQQHEQQNQQGPGQSQPQSQAPYNPYRSGPDTNTAHPYFPSFDPAPSSGTQPLRPRRQASLGDEPDSNRPASPRTNQPLPSPYDINSLPLFPPPGFPTSEMYPVANRNGSLPQPNPYMQRTSYDAQSQPQFQNQAFQVPHGNAGSRFDWNLAYLGTSIPQRRVSMPPLPGEYGYNQQVAGRMSPRTAVPSDTFQTYPVFRGGEMGPTSAPVSPNGQPSAPSYNPWNMTLSGPDSRPTNPWDMPRHDASAGPSQAPQPVDPSQKPGPSSTAPHTEDQSDTGGSRPSTAGRTAVKREPGTAGRRKSTTKKRVSIPAPVPELSKKPEEPMKEDEDDEDDVEGEEEEQLDHRKRKRNRTIRSCVPCHNHKRKCDRQRPCSRCTALGLTGSCVYEIDETRDRQDPTIAEEDRLRRRVAELEQVVRELRQRAPTRSSNAGPSQSRVGTPLLTHSDGENDGEPEKAGQDSKKRRVIVDRYARLRIDEAAMAQVAAAAAEANAGKVGNGAAVGGTSQAAGMTGQDALTRPRSASDGDAVMGRVAGKDYMGEPYKTGLLPGEEIVYDKSGRKTFLGAPAGKSMLRRLRELMSSQTPATLGETVRTAGEEDLLTVPEELAFTGWFPDMRKTFPFTTIWSHENFSGEIIGLLPNKQQAELLLESWRDEIGAFFVAWHTTTLEAEYRRFFAMTTLEKMNVPLSSLSLYLMICALGCVVRASKSEIFGHPDRAVAIEATRRGVMPERDPKDLTASRLQSELYLSAAYQALRLCSFMSNPTIYTIQSQILINVYLLNSERASDAWSQTGALVRQCIAMGLHKDPLSLDSRISMRDAEVRRRVWWSVAGLDALFCVSFGRPSSITFYTTNLPQDRTDDNLSDLPGSAQISLPPANVLRKDTTDMSFHAAYFQLTIPSLELLDRIFRIDWNYSRSAIYGWFSRNPDAVSAKEKEEQIGHTYEDAIRLAQDIFQWYSHTPRGMHFDPDEDTVESLMETRSPMRINQSLALVVKTFMIVMVLHRPYLRADPEAYPESSEICFRAAKLILSAYTVGSQTKASIFWSWWTMSFRAFHAGAVCAFLAIRQPNTELATKCLASLRGAIAIFEDRISSWNVSHPVQADLCHGLVKLQKLAVAATRQHRQSPNAPNASILSGSSIHLSPETAYRAGADSHPKPGERATTPLSQIKGFPAIPLLPTPSPDGNLATGVAGTNPSGQGASSAPHSGKEGDSFSFLGDGFNGPEQLGYPQMWANMFGIKVDGGELSEPDVPFGGSGAGVGKDMLGLI